MIRSGQLVFILLFLVSTVSAQQGTLTFNRLTLEDGLSDTFNPFVYLDSKGFVWISTVRGLNRFDGSEVKVYIDDPEDSCSIKGNLLMSPFFEDTSSLMWFSTQSALNAYDWNSDCFHSYKIKLEDNFLESYFTFYLDADQNLWSLCDEYLYTFNIPTSTFQNIEVFDSVNHRAFAMPDQNGHVTHVWGYFLNRAGLEELILDAQHRVISKKIIWETINGKPFPVRDITRQGDSLLWVLSDDAIWKYNVIKQEGRLIPIGQNDANTFEFMDDNSLLIGFKKSGLRGFDLKSEKLTDQYLHEPDNTSSLLSNVVDDINKDRLGGLWISSWRKGISYTQPKKRKFTTFYPQYLYPGIESFNPVSLFPDQPDVLLCATRSSGFYYFHRTGNGNPEISKVPGIDSRSLQGNVGFTFKDVDGNYWISTFPGLSVFNPLSGKIRHIHHKAETSSRGMPWQNHSRLFSGRGLLKIDGNMEDGFVQVWSPALKDTFASNFLWQDKEGRIWIGKENQGIIVLDSVDFKYITTIPVTGILTQAVERDATYWVCSSNGLFEIGKDSLNLLVVHNQDNGLVAPGFNSMVMDHQKRLWLTHNKGIVMYDPSIDSVKTFNLEDGLPSLQFSNAAYQFDDGEIWFTSIEGITRFYPDKIRYLDIEAIPQITEIQVNDSLPKNKLVCKITGSSNFPLIQKLIFKYADNTLAFRINSLEYSSPNHTKVKYQMKNLDAQPLEVASGSLVRYPNLPPGDYTFMVYASNSDGIYNTASRSILIHIIAPFYKTWWFYILVALSAIGIVAYIIYLRFTKALELQRVRLKLYENLHDDVGSRLTAIVLSAEDLERNEKINSPKIQSISKIAKSIVENMRRLVWAIDPENDKMNTIIQKITHDKSLILGDGIAFQIHLDDHLKNVIVPGEIRYQISSICNEAFNNIAKYAQATTVKVSLSRENKKFRLVISDNGKGFDPSLVTKNNLTGSGYGLNNMKRRASRVKGNLEIFSKPGEGTRIEAEFPY